LRDRRARDKLTTRWAHLRVRRNATAFSLRPSSPQRFSGRCSWVSRHSYTLAFTLIRTAAITLAPLRWSLLAAMITLRIRPSSGRLNPASSSLRSRHSALPGCSRSFLARIFSRTRRLLAASKQLSRVLAESQKFHFGWVANSCAGGHRGDRRIQTE